MGVPAETALSGHPGFRSVEGTAQATNLTDQSIDLIKPYFFKLSFGFDW